MHGVGTINTNLFALLVVPDGCYCLYPHESCNRGFSVQSDSLVALALDQMGIVYVAVCRNLIRVRPFTGL